VKRAAVLSDPLEVIAVSQNDMRFAFWPVKPRPCERRS
jgi:hypothetical protein